MHKRGLARLERELTMKLPTRYRDFMLAYSFSRRSWAGDLAMPDDVELLLELNREERSLPSSVASDSFFIGSDGRGADYFIRLSDPWCGVAAYDTGTHQVSILANTFEDWLSQLRAQNESEAMANPEVRRWWQFWK